MLMCGRATAFKKMGVLASESTPGQLRRAASQEQGCDTSLPGETQSRALLSREGLGANVCRAFALSKGRSGLLEEWFRSEP